MPRDDQFISKLAECLLQVPEDQQVRLYLMTFVFAPYRDHCFPYALCRGDQPNVLVHPTREDVEAGDTCRIPLADRPGELTGDVRRHYLRILSGMFGHNRARYREYHPRGFGWLDEPVGKPNKKTRYRRTRHPGDEYPHAHVVLQVRDYPWTPRLDQFDHHLFPSLLPELKSSLITRFEYLERSFRLDMDWLRLNPGGNLDVRQIPSLADTPEVLDYAAKSAKRSRTLLDDMIILPFADPPPGSKLNGPKMEGLGAVPLPPASSPSSHRRPLVWRA
ncbi:hypothetical protein SAMN05444161_7540 [Rhizobiales bacterium GAS191]|nr:hypothetical protein SAMN05444161_7540 [Rhizobiales bacterium GAS191]